MAEAEALDSDVDSNKACEEKKDETNVDFSALVKEAYAALMPTIRASNSLPKGAQWDLFCTSPAFKPIMDSLGHKTLDLMANILSHQGIKREIRKRDLEEKCELVVEANDKILERVGIHLDELSGIRSNPVPSGSEVLASPVHRASGSWNKDITQSAAWKEVRVTKGIQSPVVLKSARMTVRPQVKFHDKIDNRSIPFEPRIKDKPNALKPLAILYEEIPDQDACYSHPYEFELDRFQERIDSLCLEPRQPQKPRPVDETPLVWVATERQLEDLLQDLEKQTEIAIDLEHHSYRSFQGFTCLIQISTRETDYIVDTLELRHKLHILNKVFTDPKIVKVFHGADSDIPWLQKDFSLYVVNMFDTYQAALLLSLPRLSLAFLLKNFCNVDANKCFQLYDWRTRPLAKEAVKYAREDTHYLLYIYDMLWNKLLDRSKGGNHLLQSAIFRSTDTCKKRYWKPLYKEDSYEGMYRQSKKNFDNRQLFALRELHAWRDRVAREEDESIGYVLPNHMLLLIAETLPKEMQGILACCNPIPPLVRQNLVLLHQIILKAREQPLVVRMASVNTEARARPTQQSGVNIDGALHCPHDLTHNIDFRDDLPTLLDQNHNLAAASPDLCLTEPTTRIFSSVEGKDESRLSRVSLPNQNHFMSPFERYKRMLAYLEEEGKKTSEEKEEAICRDTQNLLDECMRERLKSSTDSRLSEVELVNVKLEDTLTNPRKRNRSQDSVNEQSLDDSVVSIKSESSTEEMLINALKKRKSEISDEICNLEDSVTSIKSEIVSPVRTKNKKKNKTAGNILLGHEIVEEEDDSLPAKKQKLNNHEEVIEEDQINTGAKRKQGKKTKYGKTFLREFYTF